jgi:prephenate dehydrogenase
MVVEDATNVEVLLRQMAVRLTAVADALHAGDQASIESFFAKADPFRRYKAQERIDPPDSAGDMVAGAKVSIELHDDSWREELLDSARRGEQITAFTTTHQASILTRAMS